MKRFTYFFVVLSLLVFVASPALVAGNTVTYTATERLNHTVTDDAPGLHTDAFDVAISSHTFTDGVGTIVFAGVPYLIMFDHGAGQTYMDFKGVRITTDEPLTETSVAMDYIGNFVGQPLVHDENTLYVYEDGTLRWWDNTIDDGVSYLRGFRGHFHINASAKKTVRRGMDVVFLEEGDYETPTDITDVTAETEDDAVRKVLIGTRLYIIGNGVCYDALGTPVKPDEINFNKQ